MATVPTPLTLYRNHVTTAADDTSLTQVKGSLSVTEKDSTSFSQCGAPGKLVLQPNLVDFQVPVPASFPVVNGNPTAAYLALLTDQQITVRFDVAGTGPSRVVSPRGPNGTIKGKIEGDFSFYNLFISTGANGANVELFMLA